MNRKVNNTKMRHNPVANIREYAMMTVLAGAVIAFVACDHTEIREIIEDRMVDQILDTVQVIDNYYLDDCVTRSGADLKEKHPFKAVNLYLEGTTLYVANPEGKSVEVFDADGMKHIRSIFQKDGRTIARDVYAEGEHLFVAAGDSREVEIFNKNTGEYLTRLGTGNLGAEVSWAGCVAATDRFVFVRDSKEKAVRVFDRQVISTTQTNNNARRYAVLKTGEHFINSPEEPGDGSYDMEIIEDSLYAFVHAAGTIYSWSLKDIEKKKDDTRTNENILTDMKVFSVSKPHDGKLFVAMEKGGVMQIDEFSVKDFQKRNFSHPSRQIAIGCVNLPAQPMIAYTNEQLFLSNGEHVECWRIHNNPTYVIHPVVK